MRDKIINILQDTDWSDNGIENMADKILLLLQVSGSVCDFCEENHRVEQHMICEKCRILLGD